MQFIVEQTLTKRLPEIYKCIFTNDEAPSFYLCLTQAFQNIAESMLICALILFRELYNNFYIMLYKFF